MRNVVISYAREDKVKVDELGRRLTRLGWNVWVDSTLRGGQNWWREVLDQIARCDVLVCALSEASLSSVACHRERAWAVDLGKPILPVALQRVTQALPRELSSIQIVDYSTPSEDAAFDLAAALAGLPPAPERPAVRPAPPTAPRSYMTDLVDQLDQDELSRAQQGQILNELEPALRSADSEERQGALHILARMKSRDDLYADTERRIQALEARGVPRQPGPHEGSTGSARSSTADPAHRTDERRPDGPGPGQDQQPQQPPHQQPYPQHAPQPYPQPGFQQFTGHQSPPPGPAPAPRQAPAPGPRPAAPPGSGPAPAGSVSALVLGAFVLSAVAIFFIPILFGGAAIALAGVAVARKQPLATIALWVAIGATLLGIVFGVIVAGSLAV